MAHYHPDLQVAHAHQTLRHPLDYSLGLKNWQNLSHHYEQPNQIFFMYLAPQVAVSPATIGLRPFTCIKPLCVASALETTFALRAKMPHAF